MICEQCPLGKLIQTDSFIWMVECGLDGTLMAREDECCFPETTLEKVRNGKLA